MALVSKITPEMRAAARLRLTTDMSIAEIAAQFRVAETTIYNWFDKMNIEKPITSPRADPSVIDDQPMDSDPAYQDPTTEELKKQFSKGVALAQKDVFFRVICALYWGEGRLGDMNDLKSTSEVSLASSDHSLINLWLKWLETSEFATKKTIRIHVNQNAPSSEDAIRRHWKTMLRTTSTRDQEIDVVRLKTSTQKITQKQKNGSAYVTLYNYLLRALLLGGISHLQSMSTK